MRFSRFGAGLLAAGLAVSLTACGGNDDSGGDLPSLTPTPSATPTSAPTTAPASPAVLPVRSTQKYGGLNLVLDHTAQPPANALAALQTYEAYERGAHKSLATNVEDPSLAAKSTGQALQMVRDVLRDQKTKKVRTGGTVTVTFKLVRASGALAAFSGCYDQSKSVLVRANGTSYVGPGAKSYPRLPLTLIVTNMGGPWKVTEYNLKAGKC